MNSLRLLLLYNSSPFNIISKQVHIFKRILIPIPLHPVQDRKTQWKSSQSLLKNSKTLVRELGNHKHTGINIIHKAKTLKCIYPSMKLKFENFLKKTEMNLHVIVENRNPKLLHTCSPNWPGPHF